MKFNRKDYLAGKCTHREYYGQFVTPFIRTVVEKNIGREKIVNSNDEHFNDITLTRWDYLAGLAKDYLTIPENGRNVYSLAGAVCILKEAARQIKEN